MGGTNSGRPMKIWACERARPIAEESSILSVFDLAKAGILEPGRSGLHQCDHGSFRYWTSGTTITLQYHMVRNDRTMEAEEITQAIDFGQIPLHWRPYDSAKPCFLCPHCGRQAYKLYIPFGSRLHQCRRCHRIAYELQTMHHGGLPYRLTSLNKQCAKHRTGKDLW